VKAITGRTGLGGIPGRDLNVVCKRCEVVHCMRPLEVEYKLGGDISPH
jgi:hypothetical protein